ncbi:uncharacterized protein LOC124447762 [Xenia sp. Carnegie-2017]|uniref:uncharacterized protein LOC124447762 n=1 Tax=Xenia sp. Carnegie-2017 TaxID=2897299 RepID=UPI001F040B35|nr:uncharacterized protein LOC124447762 [Xenia sp. Carnegie-2017]
MRNKFKKCIGECKHAAMTIKTASGIKRFQEGKGYGIWFKQLFQLVQSRDSCRPEMAIEPSVSSDISSSSSSGNPSLIDLEEEEEIRQLEEGEDSVKKSFVPMKRRKLSTKDNVGEAIALLKTMVDNDPSKELLRFMQDEAEVARKHEIEMTKLFLNCLTSSNGAHHSWSPHQYSTNIQPMPNFQPIPNFQQETKIHSSANLQQYQLPTQSHSAGTPNFSNSHSDYDLKQYQSL